MLTDPPRPPTYDVLEIAEAVRHATTLPDAELQALQQIVDGQRVTAPIVRGFATKMLDIGLLELERKGLAGLVRLPKVSAMGQLVVMLAPHVARRPEPADKGLAGRFLRALRGSSRRALPPVSPYRADVEPDVVELVSDVEARLAGMVQRIRALERQLEAAGQEPAVTPTGLQLLEVADVLDTLSAPTSGAGLARWNTLQFRELARVVRGLARYA